MVSGDSCWFLLFLVFCFFKFYSQHYTVLVLVSCSWLWFLVFIDGSWWCLVVLAGSWWFKVVLGGSCWVLIVIGGFWWSLVVLGGS